MAQYEDHSTHTHAHREPVRESSGTGTMAFIIGGLVVAVGVIAWFLMGGDIENGTATTVPADGGDASVTIENTAPAPTDDGAAMETAPATDGDAAAPATDAAPADDAVPADDAQN
ncbi:hypothetical protein [Vannielia litorea]|uniref:hypothetical protein n=1 Tax=Vannielia litorea TaxID=1217970 RepID=UPI001BCCB654|nr:hypothetical protein [Vannielia litorea]MBS8227882.1 hypothetical protein [Vannielia litorea]